MFTRLGSGAKPLLSLTLTTFVSAGHANATQVWTNVATETLQPGDQRVYAIIQNGADFKVRLSTPLTSIESDGPDQHTGTEYVVAENPSDAPIDITISTAQVTRAVPANVEVRTLPHSTPSERALAKQLHESASRWHSGDFHTLIDIPGEYNSLTWDAQIYNIEAMTSLTRHDEARQLISELQPRQPCPSFPN